MCDIPIKTCELNKLVTDEKSLRFDYKTNSTKAPITESTTISNTKCTICNHQLKTAVGLKIHVTKMHKNINKTKN
jgi:hypothetical protein